MCSEKESWTKFKSKLIEYMIDLVRIFCFKAEDLIKI